MTRRQLLSLLLISLAVSAIADKPSLSEPDDVDLRSRGLILAKIWCLIVVFIGTFVGGVSPYFVKWNAAFLTIGTQFAGGVFLGTALMHFLSDANEKFGDLTTKTYPFAFMLASAGYLLTMLADSVILFVYGASEDDDRTRHHFHADLELPDNKGSLNGRTTTDLNSKEQYIQSVAASSLADSIFLIIALCFHSVFEGIAIGVSESKSDAWKALWTICLHKIFAAIAMGIALLRMIPNRPFLSCVSYALAFAISSPVGVAVGIVIDATTQGAVADWIFAVSMGLACGVFIYVSINQLISKGCAIKETTVGTAPFLKFLAVLLGVGVIAVVMIWDT